MPKFLDLTGQTFGRLSVLSLLERRAKDGSKVYLCRCSCGNTKEVKSIYLRLGDTTSCGCAYLEIAGKQRLRHGDTSNKRQTPESRCWTNIRQRCGNPRKWDFPYYGGRGIKVCPRWEVFENFLADMGRRPSSTHSIDRIDNDGPYSPENCRWATRLEQAKNRRPPEKNRYADEKALIGQR